MQRGSSGSRGAAGVRSKEVRGSNSRNLRPKSIVPAVGESQKRARYGEREYFPPPENVPERLPGKSEAGSDLVVKSGITQSSHPGSENAEVQVVQETQGERTEAE